MTPRVLAATAVAAAAAATALVPVAFDPLHPGGGGPLLGRVFVVAIGASFIAAGLVAAWRRPQRRRTASLLVATGGTWWLMLLIGTRVPLLWTLASTLMNVPLVLLYYLLITYPEGRRPSRWEALAAAGFALVFLLDAAFAAFYDPATFGCPNCQPGLNLLLVRDDPSLILLKDDIVGPLALTSTAALTGLLVWRFVRSSRSQRRALAPMIAPALVFLVPYAAYLVFQQFAKHGIYEASTTQYRTTVTVFLVGLLIVPIGYIIGLNRVRARRARVGDLLLEISRVLTPAELRSALTDTLQDDSLELGIWVEEAGRYLRPDGRVLETPTSDPRVVTELQRSGQPLAAIVHDPALFEDAELFASVTTAVRLALENERLQRDLRERLTEVEASRTRLVEAADAERRRIERNLHDGAQQRLVALSLSLQQVGSRLDGDVAADLERATKELEDALAELRELARGTYPAALSEGGLQAAVESLADRCAIATELHLDELSERRYPEMLEATAYFVVCEALANVSRYSGATRVTIAIGERDGSLEVRVADDGVGGANPARGTGLRGLLDRVEAVGGELQVSSPLGVGTTVHARLPCAS